MLKHINLKMKGEKMKKMFVLAALGIACAGCFDTGRNQKSTDDFHRSDGVVECRFAELGKVLGLSEAIFADTNRFPAAANRVGTAGKFGDGSSNCSVKLPTPVFGCTRAVVFWEQKDPLQLNSVKLECRFKGTGEELRNECLKICREIAGIIGVEFNEDDADNGLGFRGYHTVARFVLADAQEIRIYVQDALYVNRDGGYVAVQPAQIGIKFEFNESSYFAHLDNSLLKRMKKELRSGNAEAPSSETKKIDIGCDCSKLVAREVKSANSRMIELETNRREFEKFRQQLKVLGRRNEQEEANGRNERR